MLVPMATQCVKKSWALYQKHKRETARVRPKYLVGEIKLMKQIHLWKPLLKQMERKDASDLGEWRHEAKENMEGEHGSFTMGPQTKD